jgi:methyl-accepting chemotaxis protein
MKNLKIRSKLFILVGMLIVGLIALGMTSLSFMSKINGSSTILAENWLPSTIAAEELNTLTSDYRINEFAHIVAQDQKSMASYETEMERIKGEIDATFNNYTSNLATDDTDRSMMEDARAAWQEYLSIHDRMITLSRENQTQEAMRLVNGEAKTLFDQASATLLKVVNFNTEGGTQASLDGDELYSGARLIMTAVIILLVAAGVLSMWSGASLPRLRRLTRWQRT